MCGVCLFSACAFKKKKNSLVLFFVVFCFFFFSLKIMWVFFSFHHKYIHTHKVVTECVINTLSVSIYTYTYIYNQIWEPDDLDLFVSKKREDFLCARERFSSSSSFFSFLL